MNNQRSLSEILNQIIRDNGWSDEINKHRLYIAWDEVMGPAVSKRTEKIFLTERRCLVVNISSPALRHELSGQRTLIIKRLKEQTGLDLVDSIQIR